MDKFNRKSLIRTRINENLLKVKNETPNVKSLLSLSLQRAQVKHEYSPASSDSLNDLNLAARFTCRKDLLRTSILLATSRNTAAQENLIHVISKKLGKIKDKDYLYIAELIHLKNPEIVERVNDFLSYYLEGFEQMHKKYINKFYAF